MRDDATEPNVPPAHSDDPDAVVVVRGLHKSYVDGTEAVRGIDLDVRRGEVVGLLGPNGAGKTTTVEILTGLRDRSTGSVSVLGRDPGTRDGRRALRREVGVVLQQTGHHRYLTARETVELHAAYHEAPRAVDEVLHLVGLEASASKMVRELSGGQQRRLDVAVAIVGRPLLVFLDEPTTGFDPAARQRAWAMVRGLRALGTTVVLTTHYMEEARVLADRLVVMRSGRIVAEGSPAEIGADLDLSTSVSFLLPEGVEVEELPTLAPDASLALDDRRVVVSTSTPTAVLADLCGWARDLRLELPELAVEPPSLEASYLALTDQRPEVSS